MGLFSKKITFQDIVNSVGIDLAKKFEAEEHTSKIILEVDISAVEMMMKVALNEDVDDNYAKWFIAEATNSSANDVSRTIMLSSVNRSLANATNHKLPKKLEGASTFQMIYIVYVDFLESIHKKPLCTLE